MENCLVVIFAATAATYIGGKLYIVFWNRIIDTAITPAGFGILLPLIPIALATAGIGDWGVSIASFWIILVAGIVYWLDDFRGLTPWIRISIAFFFGALLFWFGVPENFFTGLDVLSLSIAFGVFSIVLTNVVNFYDGADLNLATMIFITGIILVFFSDTPSLTFQNIGWVMVGFSLGFGWINRIPLTLYLGDAGCFVVALLFLFFSINYALGSSNIPAELMLVLCLPVFDVLYVLVIRLYFKHDLLSRNYLHLYQRIRIKFGGFAHLLPQFLNVGGTLLMAEWIQSAGISRFWGLFASGIAFTPVFYLTCRILLVERNYFFGDGESN